jgi:hypothetical protein
MTVKDQDRRVLSLVNLNAVFLWDRLAQLKHQILERGDPGSTLFEGLKFSNLNFFSHMGSMFGTR